MLMQEARARVLTFRAYYEEWALANGKKAFDDLTIFEAELAAGMFAQGTKYAADIVWNAGEIEMYAKIQETANGRF